MFSTLVSCWFHDFFFQTGSDFFSFRECMIMFVFSWTVFHIQCLDKALMLHYFAWLRPERKLLWRIPLNSVYILSKLVFYWFFPAHPNCPTWEKSPYVIGNSEGSDQSVHLRNLIRTLFLDIIYDIQRSQTRVTKVQIRLRICAVWSGPSLPACAITTLISHYVTNVLTGCNIFAT